MGKARLGGWGGGGVSIFSVFIRIFKQAYDSETEYQQKMSCNLLSNGLDVSRSPVLSP